MGTILIALLMTFASKVVALATEAGAKPNHAIINSPKCYNNLTENVEFINSASDRQKFAAGMARRDAEGTPTVYRFNYQFAPSELQSFIDLHECAHHQVGDVDQPHPPRNSSEHLMNESIADCIAALRFRDEYQKSETDFEKLITALRSDMEQIGFPEISVSSRISNITHCYTSYGPADIYIRNVIKQRASN